MIGLGANGETVHVRWYFTDQPFLPFSTVFCSREWYDENPPWALTKPGPVRHRGHWANGKGPIACCTVPFGDHRAFLGDGTGSRFSCAWIEVEVRVALTLRPRAEVVSPRQFRGRVALRLVPRSTVKNPATYRGRVPLSLVPRSSVLTPRTYYGRVPLSLVPRSSVLSPRTYAGRVPLDLVVRSTYSKGFFYPGRVPLDLVVRSTYSPGRTYAGRVPLELLPRATVTPPNPEIVWGPCSLTYSRWTLTVSGITGTGSDNYNGTWILEYNSTLNLFATFTGGTGPRVNWILGYVSFGSGTVYVHANQLSTPIADWEITPASAYNCLASNGFPLSGSSLGSGWPSTLTVSPA